MTYGSWSGGIYILELDAATGQPKYPKTTSGNTDGYFGKKIAGGYKNQAKHLTFSTMQRAVIIISM